jgi:bis(5'-nucleosyl)-tetraphosphatase (symmetrical)
MATYAIGDVQGCYDALSRLLDAIKFDATKDQIWFCGDLVNRGGQSLEVLRLVKSIDQSSVTVLGNHDLSLLAISEREESAQRRVNPDLQRVIFAEDRDALLGWLRERPLFHADAGLGFALIHAGLAPKWTLSIAAKRAREVEQKLRNPRSRRRVLQYMYGNKPAAWSPSLQGLDRTRAIINVFTRLRYCDVKGRIAFDEKGAPGSQTPGLYPWYEVPGHAVRDLKVVFGHWSTLGLFQGLGVLGIDTGSVWGGKLTAVELNQDCRIIQVDGKAGATRG